MFIFMMETQWSAEYSRQWMRNAAVSLQPCSPPRNGWPVSLYTQDTNSEHQLSAVSQ